MNFFRPVDMTRLSKRKLNYWSVRLVRQSMKQRVLIAQSNAFTQVYKSNCWKTTFTIPLPQQQSPTAGSDDEDNSDSSISDGFYDDSGYDSDYNGVSTAEKLNEEPDLIDSSAHYRLELEYNYHMKFTIVSDQFQVVQVDDSCFAHTFPPLSPRSRRRRPIQILNGIGDVDKWHQQFGEGSDTKYFHYQLNEYTTVKGQLSADTRLPYGTIHYELHGGLLVLTANYDGSNGRLNSSAGLTLRYADGQEFRGNHFSLVSMSDIDETDYFDGLLLDGQPHGYKRQLIDPEKGVVYEGLVVESKPAVIGVSENLLSVRLY
jgi:hypothetical protein